MKRANTDSLTQNNKRQRVQARSSCLERVRDMYRWAGWSIGSSLPLSAQCVLAAIDSGHAQRALETGTMPVMAFVMGLRELPEGTRDALFEDRRFEHYQTFVMSRPALYTLHQFSARSNAELQELPRDIERLDLLRYDAIAFELLGEFSNLTRLNLHGNRIGDEGMTALASLTNLQRLTHLGLRGNRIGYERARRPASGQTSTTSS